MSVEPVFTRRYSGKERALMISRLAAAFDAITTGKHEAGILIDGRVIRGLRTQGYIEDDCRPTPLGIEWRDGYTGAIAPLADITRRSTRIFKPTRKTKPTPIAKPTPKEGPSTVARDLIAAGLVFVHPKLIDDLSTEELALWIKAKRHERDGLTLTALARLLGEPVEHVRIRAERIVEKGYAIAVRGEDEANHAA